MTTITAKELRDNLENIVVRAQRGEVIRVTYRSKPAFLLQRQSGGGELLPGSQEAMKKFVASTSNFQRSKTKSTLSAEKSAKQLYHELLDDERKYQRGVS